MASEKVSALSKFLKVLRYEKQEITSIYFYAILSGLVQLSLPVGIQSIISFVLGGSMSTSLVLLITFVIAGVFIAGLLQVNQMKLIEKIQQQLFVRYSFQYAHTIPNLNLKDVDGYYLPELTNRFFDTISLQKGIAKLLLEVPAATIQIFFGLLLLSFYHPVFIFFGLFLLLVLYLILRATANKGMETSITESNFKYQIAGYLQELARLVTTFKFSRNNSLHLFKTDEFVTNYLHARTAHFKILQVQYWTLIAFKVLITAAMLIVGAFLLVNQQLNIGQFIAAEIVILMVIGSVEKLIINLDKVYDVFTSVEKISKLTEKPKEQSGKVALDNIGKGVSVQFKNLSFGYTPNHLVLKDISFTINPGEVVCIQGSYSSGKSTLLRLMSGAYSNFSGNLLVNGIPINNYNHVSLRKQSGIMLHTQDIFQGTLRENICMGDESITWERMNSLAEMAGLKQFIDSKENGFDMVLQPMGQHLSGRIIKKIILLRSLVHSPSLLLLEDPWLGLEDVYQHQIKDFLLHSLPGTTVIIVSNDTSFSRNCDKTIILDNGSIVNITEK